MTSACVLLHLPPLEPEWNQMKATSHFLATPEQQVRFESSSILRELIQELNARAGSPCGL